MRKITIGLHFIVLALVFSGCYTSRRPPVFIEPPGYFEEVEFIKKGCCEEEDFECDCPELPTLPPVTNIGSTDPYEPQIKEYHISAGDTLSISVVGDPDTLVENVVVAPDGYIYYLCLNGIKAEGMTVRELQGELEKQLDHLFLHPSVNIFPKVMSNQKFIILGRVNKPGVYPLLQSVTLRQGIGMAGGILSERDIISQGAHQEGGAFQAVSNYNIPIFSLKNSFVIREGKRLDLNFEDLLWHPEKADDIYLKPGDYIHLAADDRPGIYVLGAVESPMIVPYQNDLTFLQALSYASGWLEGDPYSADVNNALVIRGSLECPEVARVNLCDIIHGRTLDFYLEPGDIIYIHNKHFRFGRTLVYIAVSGFLQGFTNVAAAYYGFKWFNSGD